MTTLTLFDRDLIVRTWERKELERERDYWKAEALKYKKKFAGKFKKKKTTKK